MGYYNEKLSILLENFNEVFQGHDIPETFMLKDISCNSESFPVVFELLVRVSSFCLERFKLLRTTAIDEVTALNGTRIRGTVPGDKSIMDDSKCDYKHGLKEDYTFAKKKKYFSTLMELPVNDSKAIFCHFSQEKLLWKLSNTCRVVKRYIFHFLKSFAEPLKWTLTAYESEERITMLSKSSIICSTITHLSIKRLFASNDLYDTHEIDEGKRLLKCLTNLKLLSFNEINYSLERNLKHICELLSCASKDVEVIEMCLTIRTYQRDFEFEILKKSIHICRTTFNEAKQIKLVSFYVFNNDRTRRHLDSYKRDDLEKI